MFTFSTAALPPIPIKINGTVHKVPRFLMPDMTEWIQQRAQEREDAATKHLDDHRKAQFLTYNEYPIPDVGAIANFFKTPVGVPLLLRRQLPKADPPVDPAMIEAMIENSPPDLLAALSSLLCSASQAAAILAEQSGEPEGSGTKQDDPLAKPGQGSGDKQSTGKSSSRSTRRRTSRQSQSSPSTPT